MSTVSSVLGAMIRLLAEAMAPLAIALVAIVVFLFAGNVLLAWKERAPAKARAVGYVIATLAGGAALYLAARVVPATRANDPVHEGVALVSLFDPVVSAFCAAVAGLMWRFAGKRWIGGVLAAGVAAALIAKPFVSPLFRTYDGNPRTFSPTSETHLFFLLSGLALAVVALVMIVVSSPRTLADELPTARVR